MIKNIIFDMGGVLKEFNPELFLDRMNVTDLKDRKILLSEVFKSKEWAMMDRGSLDEPEAFEIFKENVPAYLHPIVEKIVFHWENYSNPIYDVCDFAKELKERGYNLYLLSNATKRLRKDYWPYIPSHELFTGLIVSGEIELVKPQDAIFKHLFKTFNLEPSECLLIDDMSTNIEAAVHNGMQGVVYHQDIEELVRKVNKELDCKQNRVN